MEKEIFNLEFEKWNLLVLKFNWFAVVLIVIAAVGVSFIWKKLVGVIGKRSINIDEVQLGIGSNTIKLKYNNKMQEIAYKLWVELSTRKMGMPYDENNDVIYEVYNSWYKFFLMAREEMEKLPPEQIEHSKDLIDLIDKVLNNGLRPHLTRWQARFRKWYESELKKDEDSFNSREPQKIQKTYPEYDALLQDIKNTNTILINYTNLMHDIAFKK